jgi:hypothetical protein
MYQSSRGPQALLTTAVLSGAVGVAGAAMRIRPAPDTAQQSGAGSDDNQVYSFVASIQANGGASTPVCSVIFEGSCDKVTWFPLAQTADVPANDVVAQLGGSETTGARIPPYVRARTVPGGGTPPTKIVATAWVISSNDFILEPG